MNGTRRAWLLASPALLLVALLFAAPLALLVRVSLYEGGGASGNGTGRLFYVPDTWTLGAYADLLDDRLFWSLLSFTVRFGLVVAVLATALGFGLALLIHRLGPPWKALALGAVVLPKLANVLVVTYGLELLLGNIGPVNQVLRTLRLTSAPVELLHNYAGTLIGEMYAVLPYVVLLMVAALDRIDPLLAVAARGLGSNPFRAFRRVTLPLAAPSLALAFLLALIFALGAYVSPYLLGSPDQYTLAVDVQRQAFENLNWPRGAAEAVLMLATLAGCALLCAAAARLWRRA